MKSLLLQNKHKYLYFWNILNAFYFALNNCIYHVYEYPLSDIKRNTERPVMDEVGTNTLCGLDSNKILNSISKIIKGKYKKEKIPNTAMGGQLKRSWIYY